MQPLSPSRWTLSDAIDLEQSLANDAVMAEHAAAFKDACGSSLSSTDRPSVFLAWTRFVRERSAGTSPGEIYRRARRLTATLLAIFGFVAGATLAGSLLARRDAEPVNALLFLGGTVGLQVAFLMAVSLVAALRAAKVSLDPVPELVLAIVRLLGRTVDRLDGEQRAALQSRWATLDLRSARLAPLIGCDLLVVTQRFAIAFNVGLLAAMLLVYLPFEELRFGWQSTYSFTADGVETAVRVIAAPWSWLSSTLVPNSAEIVATRFVRGQRAETFPADAAHAWWPFLLAAIVVYGLMVRALLAVAAKLVLRRRLQQVDVTQPAANALWRRLVGPLMQPSGGAGRLPSGAVPMTAGAVGGVDLLIVDRDSNVPLDDVRLRVERCFGGQVARIATATVDDDALPDDAIATLVTAINVVVAIAASRDPIVAVAGFLNALVARAPGAAITIALMPDDAADGVPDERFGIWQRFVAIQRLRVGVERTP